MADLIEPELGAATEEILETIAREVPEYARPLEGRFGRGIRTGVAEALSQFVALIRDPDAGRDPGREVYVALGRGELRQGRTLDSLQAAYRVGARVAWRRFAAAVGGAKLGAAQVALLAESIFAYIDELAADSVEGYAAAQSAAEEIRARRRHELVALLVREPPAELADLRAAAGAAGWKLPRRLAPLACGPDDLEPISRRLPADALHTRFEQVGCILIPDPAGPGREAEVGNAVGRRSAALGASCDPSGLAGAWRLALTGLRAAAAGALPGEGLVDVEGHLAELLLFEARPLGRRIASRRLAPFVALTPKARLRMEETALAFVRCRGNSVEMAAELHVHPQTARYRLARLRELLGDQLDDPDARFELELALRSPAPTASGAPYPPVSE
ncbi:MAG TPA: helix-turn-helix domain-containing protein [Solirubrobacterales bacterium]|nr:helix-turn-helix domain-containing protein [Solirubrobacterales bacterium]